MKLPASDSAIVDDAKVRDYLLSSTHPIGRFKARVFASFGYQQSDWHRLRDDLLTHATGEGAEAGEADSYGQRWLVRGDLASPSGRPLPIVSVWLIPSEGQSPRLITAYPASPS
jgi:hypothetical protein